MQALFDMVNVICAKIQETGGLDCRIRRNVYAGAV